MPKIISLEKRMRDPGDYTATFNINTVLSGQYVYCIKAGSYKEYGKLLIVNK